MCRALMVIAEVKEAKIHMTEVTQTRMAKTWKVVISYETHRQ